MNEVSEYGRPVLPARVFKKDRRFHKGLFVAANVKMSGEGEPLFGQVDSEKVVWMQQNRHCQLCGRRIAKTDWCVFPGAFGMLKYQEAPLHIDCARYSALVCPHIWRNRENFGFSVCRKYVYVEFAPPMWLDEGCIPQWDGLGQWAKFALSMAHDVRRDENGKVYCTTCSNNENAGMMSFPEFMKWSAL